MTKNNQSDVLGRGKTLAAALGSAGRRTVLIEKIGENVWGTCINVGCISTKFLVNKARKATKLKGFSRTRHKKQANEIMKGKSK